MGLPQHFPPRGLPVQQHNIMGQPFIELRHRAPENRVRLPFISPNVLDHPNHFQRSSTSLMVGQNMAFPGTHGPRPLTPVICQPQQGSVGHLQMSARMENLHEQANMPKNTHPHHPPVFTTVTHSVGGEAFISAQPTLLSGTVPGPAEEIPLPCADGIEEKLDADDSAVKDLEDVEVKDLVDDDLENLNLDADDGKDIDLETNDLHLDDFIESGKFDLLAYADPELNLEDKKDMFNEELDLSDPIEDDHGETTVLQKVLSEKKSPQTLKKLVDGELSSHGKQRNFKVESAGSLLTTSNIKTEITQDSVISEDHSVGQNRPLDSKNSQGEMSSLFEGSSQHVPSGSAPVLSSLLTKEKLDDSGISPVALPLQCNLVQGNHGPEPQPNMGMMLQGQSKDHGIHSAITVGPRMDDSLVHGAPLGNPTTLSVGSQQLPVPGFGASPGQQVDINLPMLSDQQPAPHTLHPQTQQVMYPQGSMGQQGTKIQQCQSNRPLLLDEQPLLLQDLLDQERQEQQQQRQMQAMIRERSNDPFFPNVGKACVILLFKCCSFINIQVSAKVVKEM